jgi:hypothetical protein
VTTSITSLDKISDALNKITSLDKVTDAVVHGNDPVDETMERT